MNALEHRRSCVALALLAAGGSTIAQSSGPAAVGRERPLTSAWQCENERGLLLNAHPHRRSEEAWLTYAGTRVAVERLRRARGVTYASADGKLRWTESGDQGVLEFEGLLDRPLTCRRVEARPR